MTNADIVIVGSGVATGYFCKAVSEANSKFNVLVIGKECFLPYERPALTKGFLTNGGMPVEKFLTCAGTGAAMQDQKFYDRHNVSFKLNTEVVKIDPDAKMIMTENDEIIKANVALVLAMGSKAVTLDDLKIDVRDIKKGLHYLREVDDVTKLLNEVKQMPRGSDIVVIGGGYIGMESAAGLVGFGHKITMIFPESKVMDRFMTDRLAKFYEGKYKAAGIRILKGDSAKGFEHDGDGALTGVVLQSGKCLPARLIVVGIGARPNIDLVKDKLELCDNAPGGILVGGTMQSSRPNVYVIGELAAVKSENTIKRYEHVHYARATAKKAAEAICSPKSTQNEFVYHTYFYSRVLNMQWAMYGLPPNDSVDIYYAGDLSVESDGRFAAFWVTKADRRVISAFIEGGTNEEKALVAKTVEERRTWPLREPILPRNATIN